jgi:chemotaxis protein MotB
MPTLAWKIAGVLTTLLVVGILGFTAWNKDHDLEQARAELAEARAAAEKTQAATTQALAEAAALKERLTNSQSRIDELQHEKDAVVQSHRSLEDEMRAALESKDVTISKLQGKLTVNILDRVLFDSGESELRNDGSGILRKVAGLLAQHPTLKIHVIGHTDNIPIRGALRGRFPTNWELSTARATAAVRFLVEKAGVDPRRVGAVGYGEFRPIADNNTVEGRARNRRIAITILSDELAGADIPPPAPIISTNAPPVETNTGPDIISPPEK